MASEHRRAVGIFSSRPKTASALQALSDSGFSMSNVSVIAKDPKQQNAIAGVEVKGEVSNRASTGGTVGAVTGGVLGGVTGLLVGLGTLTIPGIGPALLAGEAAAIISTLVGGAAGAAAGSLVGALIGLGIPEHRAKRYRDRVANGDYLVMLRDTDPEIARAEQTLKAAGIEDWGVYQAPKEAKRSKDDPHAVATHTAVAQNSGTAVREESAYRPVDRPTDRDYVRSDLDYSDNEQLQQKGLPHASNPMGAQAVNTESVPKAEERRVIGIFHDQMQMEEALTRLRQTGFPMHTLSIAVREANMDTTRNHITHPLTGAMSLASGLDRVSLPDVGPVLVMGPDANALSIAVYKNEFNSATGILESLGIAQESANLYSRYLMDGDYLVTLRGRNQEVLEAASVLGKCGMRDWGVYDVRHS